jgi:hypothetical protein
MHHKNIIPQKKRKKTLELQFSVNRREVIMMDYKLNLNFPWQIILQKIVHKKLEVPEGKWQMEFNVN